MTEPTEGGPDSGPPLDPPPPTDPVVADREALRGPRRVSLFGPIFLAWAVVRQLGVVNIGIFTALIGTGNIRLLGIGVSSALLVAGLVRWLRFTYELETTDEGDQLVTLSGVFARNRTSVPLDRVQAVATRQNLLHRIFGLVEVKVQTAGSAGAEVELAAVRPHVAEQIRRLTTVTRTSGHVESRSPEPGGEIPPPPGADSVLRRSIGDVLLVAFTRNPLVLLAPIPIAAGVAAEWGDLLSGLSDEAGDAVGGLADSAAGIVGLIVVILVVSIVLSTTAVVFRLFDLRVHVDGAGLRRVSGLVSRTELTASLERVQVIDVQRNPLERLVGHHELQLPVAGGGAAAQTGGAAPTALDLPGSTAAEVGRITDLVLGAGHAEEPGHDAPQGISPLAVRRWTQWLGLAPTVVVIAALWWLVGPPILLVALWVPFVWAVARLRQRSWSWSLGPDTLRIRNGVWNRVRRDMPVRKTQNINLRQGFFHRRHGLADVRVRTASHLLLVVPMLPLDEARALRDQLMFRAETDPRPFM